MHVTRHAVTRHASCERSRTLAWWRERQAAQPEKGPKQRDVSDDL
jgi:hypothetical protein